MAKFKGVVLSVIILLCTVSCQKCDAWRFRGFTSLAEEFSAAAARSDTVALQSMATEEATVDRALLMRRLEPEYWPAAAGHLTYRFGEVRADTAVIEFAFPYEGSGSLGVRFRKLGEAWKVDWVQQTYH